MKKILTFLGVLAFLGMQAQTGKVGINTDTPTENLDVKGTMRVRTLPKKDEAKIYTTGDNTSVDNANQKYIPTRYVTADANGVLGYADQVEVGAQKGSNPTTTNESTALFVKKIYTTGDNPTRKDTGFSTAKWDAVIMINSAKRKGTQFRGILGDANGEFTLKLVQDNGTWKITGDITSTQESWEFTVLFINKNIIASDNTITEL